MACEFRRNENWSTTNVCETIKKKNKCEMQVGILKAERQKDGQGGNFTLQVLNDWRQSGKKKPS